MPPTSYHITLTVDLRDMYLHTGMQHGANHQIVTLQENFVRVYELIKFPASLVDVCHVNIMCVVLLSHVLSHILIQF